MSLRSRWKNWRQKRIASKAAQDVPSSRPLREFVYLDEVSLRSLLVSQKDTIPEQVSRAISDAEQAEVTGKLSAGTDLLGKGELGSRFQTSNSNSVQTSRKAIVQTLFNELRDEKAVDYTLVVTTRDPDRFSGEHAVANSQNPACAMPASGLRRGGLVEIEVVLDVDPIFRIGTLLSEFSAMAEENDAIAETVGRSTLEQLVPMNRLLQRLLTGLIPIRATAINMSVVSVNGKEHVAHKKALEGLNIQQHPLVMVGVTEHLGYWKDIRRVLFSSSPVTVLCRIGRSGLQSDWTPVKLADLFRDVAPDLLDQLHEMSRNGMNGFAAQPVGTAEAGAMWKALTLYRRDLEKASGIQLGELEEAALLLELMGNAQDFDSSLGQRRAFGLVREVFDKKAGSSVLEASADLSMREEARKRSGLGFFTASGPTVAHDVISMTPRPDRNDRLLDVEVVAIYW